MPKKRRTSSREGTRTYQIELTLLSLFVYGFCLLFLLSWIFVLGILVGRGYLPEAVTDLSDLRKQMSRIQEMVSRSRSEELKAKKETDQEPKLAFYDRLSSKKEETVKKQKKTA